MLDFKDQVVLVTGGTRGIGAAITTAFLNRGAKVIATYASNDEAATAFKASLGELAERIDPQKFDVSDHDAVQAYFEGHHEATYQGKLDVLVNNGGIRRDGLLATMKPEDWSRVLDINLTGCFNMSKFAVLRMMKQRYGRIVNITSPSGKFGFSGQTNYSASKAGQVGLTRSLAKEVARRKITVNCVSPGFIDTELIADLPEELRKEYSSQVPLKRFGLPEEVANCVLFLSSAEASYVTGSVLEVAGGL
jgi:3-oxoacyl-[acyl-carrier protein] reductase